MSTPDASSDAAAESVRVGLAARFCAGLMSFYRRYLSCLKPRCCRFSPSCSEYAREAFLIHGFWRGMGLTVWRLLRCQPFYRGNLNDPVPPRRHKPKQ